MYFQLVKIPAPEYS